MTADKTNWAALRDRNPDRAQLASLAAGASAGTPAGTSDLDRMAAEIVEHCESPDAPYFMDEAKGHRAFVADRLRPLMTERDELSSSLNAAQALALTLGIEFDQLKAAVRAWHAGAPSWNAEDDLYARVLELAGVEPAGPPVVAAGAGLDVERLVEALCQMTTGVDVRRVQDDTLRGTWRAVYDAQRHTGFDVAGRAALRSLVLAALGTPDAMGCEVAADIQRARLACDRCGAPAGIGCGDCTYKVCLDCYFDHLHGQCMCAASYTPAILINETTTTRPQAAASEEAQDAA
jgi:hypothetical protein